MFGKGTTSGKVLCYILLVCERGLRQRIAEGKGARLDLQTATKPIHLDVICPAPYAMVFFSPFGAIWHGLSRSNKSNKWWWRLYIVVYLVGRDDSASFQGFDPPTQPFITKHWKGIQKHLTKATPKKAHLNTLLETNSESSENSPSFKGMSSSNCYFLRGKRAQPEVMDFSRGGDLRQQAGRNASTARLQSKSLPCVV